MFGMRNEGADKPYREKLGHHLKLFYGDRGAVFVSFWQWTWPPSPIS